MTTRRTRSSAKLSIANETAARLRNLDGNEFAQAARFAQYEAAAYEEALIGDHLIRLPPVNTSQIYVDKAGYPVFDEQYEFPRRRQEDTSPVSRTRIPTAGIARDRAVTPPPLLFSPVWGRPGSRLASLQVRR